MRENGLIRRSTLWRTDLLEGHGHRNYCPSVRFPIYVLSITPECLRGGEDGVIVRKREGPATLAKKLQLATKNKSEKIEKSQAVKPSHLIVFLIRSAAQLELVCILYFSILKFNQK